MKLKRLLLWMMVFLLVGCSSKPMELPKSEALRSIEVYGVSEPTGIAVKEDPKDIEMILGQFGSAKATSEESVNDSPQNAEGVIRIDLIHSEVGASSMFIYQRDGKYFAEQPYAGVWEIEQGVYDDFAQLAQNAEIPRAMMVDGKLYLDSGKEVINGPT